MTEKKSLSLAAKLNLIVIAAIMEMMDPEDKAHNIGMRMVYGSARSMSYQHILGLNALTIRI